MKWIIAYIQPERFREVKAELDKIDVHRMSVNRVKGMGQQRGFTESFRGVKTEMNLMPKLKLEIGVNDSFVEKTIKAIIKGARTDNVGDGKIFVLPVEECIRIRTGERGITAIGGDSEELKREQSLAFSKSIGKDSNGDGKNRRS